MGSGAHRSPGQAAPVPRGQRRAGARWEVRVGPRLFRSRPDQPGSAAVTLRPWPDRWRGRWIWDREPARRGFWWNSTGEPSHWTYLRRVFRVDTTPASLPARATCDSRYALYLNERLLGRGPVRSEPEFLGWDTYELAPHLVPGLNVIVALCHYYGRAGPWWVPASALGTLGRGSFCFETAPDPGIDLATGPGWQAVPAPWIPNTWQTPHAFPPEVIDGRLAPAGLHDPLADPSGWAPAVPVAGAGHGTVLDRPPAAPYITPERRSIPQLTALTVQPRWIRATEPGPGDPAGGHPPAGDRRVTACLLDNPVDTWHGLALDDRGDRIVSVWDAGRITRGYVRMYLRLRGGG